MTARHRRARRWPSLVGTGLALFAAIAGSALASRAEVREFVTTPLITSCRDVGSDLYRDGRTWWTQQCGP